MKIFISPKALLKMQALVMGYNKEVGWWGTVEKIKTEEYRIKDILVFPQYTGAAYIDDEAEDPLEMAKWLDGLSDEEFNEKRFFGHSHVNMGTYFSGEDTRMFDRQVDVIKRAPVNNFYLSVVLNKKGDMCWKVWDGETDKKYSDNEIEILFEVEDGLTNIDFFENSKEMVRDLKRKSSNSLIFGGGSKEETFESYKYPSYKQRTYQVEDTTVPCMYYSKQDTLDENKDDDDEDFYELCTYVKISDSRDIEVDYCERRIFNDEPNTIGYRIFGSDTLLVMDTSVKAEDILGAETLYGALRKQGTRQVYPFEDRIFTICTEDGYTIDIDYLTNKALYNLLHRNCVVEDEESDYVLITVEGEIHNEYE